MATHSNILTWENPMDGGAWQDTVHGVAKSWTQVSMHANTQLKHRNQKLCHVVTSNLGLRSPPGYSNTS